VHGTVTEVGERLSKGEETTFRSLEISRSDGKVQRLTVVRAVRQVAELIEQNSIGTFFVLQANPEECWLCAVAREDGTQVLDTRTMRQVIQTFDADKVADAR